MSVKIGDNLELILGATVTGLPDPVGDTDAAARAWVIQEISDAITAAGGLDPEAVQDIVGAMFADTATLDVAYDDSTGAITLTVLDSPTVDGETPADLRDRATHTGTQDADTLTDGTTNKVYTATEKTKLAGIATGATANDTDANLKNRANHTGTQSADTLTDGTTNKAFLATERTKLAGIATGATANSSDATLLARANHTGTQLSTTISDFAAAVVTAVNAASNIDADTLGGSTAAQLQTAITAAIVNGAGSTLDTLNELAAALGNDPNFATTVTNALAARVQSYDTTVGDGTATTYNVDHNLNTKKVTVQIYETGDDFESVWATIKRPTVNRVTVTFASAPSAGQYTVVVQGKPGA